MSSSPRDEILKEFPNVLIKCHKSVDVFLTDLIAEVPEAFREKSEPELMEYIKNIDQLSSDFSQAIKAYLQAVDPEDKQTP